jgi:hypothetical protein
MASSKSTIRNVKRGCHVDIEKETKQATEISNELPCACMQISGFFPDVKDLERGSIEPASVSGGMAGPACLRLGSALHQC